MATVIIVNWNGREWLPECLDGLRRQVYQDFSMILVDNGSQDGSAGFVSKNYPEVNIVALQDNHGFAAANNIALRTVKTELRGLKQALKKRQWIQSRKVVNDGYLWNLFEPTRLTERLLGRFKHADR